MTLGPAYTEYKERRARESGVESLYEPLMNRTSLALSLDSSQLAGHVSDEKAERPSHSARTPAAAWEDVIDTHIHMYTHTTNIHAETHKSTHTFTHTHVCIYKHAYICVHTYMHRPTNIHMYANTHAYSLAC